MDDPQPGTSAMNLSANTSTNPTPNQSDDEIEQNMRDYSSDSEEEIDSDEEEVIVNPTWCSTTAGLRDIPFTKENKFLCPIPGDKKPIDFFNLLFDEIFIETIVRHTNKKAEQVFLDQGHTERARISAWKPVTVDEMKTFIGLMMHTGTIKLSKINDYWKTHWLFSLPGFRGYMGRDRYLNILRCFTFYGEARSDAEKNDRLFKVRDLVSYFNLKMDHVYYPSKELSIDESMILWRGRLILRQYLKGKKHKYGIKLYTLAEPEGLVLRFFVYGGRGDVTSGKGHAEKVVLELMKGKLGVGHSIYIDNYYNSFHLASVLLSKKTYCTGTLRQDRVDTPPEIRAAKPKKDETIARYSDGVMIGTWKDKRKVVYISTEFENTMATSLNRWNQERQKPLPIVQYNAHMKGIDRADQLQAYYPCERKTVRWYMKVFEHTLGLIMSNAMQLHNIYHTDDKMNLYDFRLSVLEQILPRPPRPGRTLPQAGRHTIEMTNARGNDGRLKRKRCRVCHCEKRSKLTPYFCVQCPDQPGLCPTGCFDLYHTQQ
uniref:Uncharacterized protein n=1 Tax=Graphocephala atropunctata TaxID=36148 RepID=A0A1B6L7B9_9HEMI